MANWKRHMSVEDVWETNDIHLIAQAASERLKVLTPFTDYPFIEDRRIELVSELESFSKDPDVTVADFDSLWNDLYDWGDISLDGNWNGEKVCWIATF